MRYMLLYPLIITVATFFGVSTGVAQGTWTHFTGDGITTPDQVRAMAIDNDGVLWVSGSWGGIWSYDGTEWRTRWLRRDGEWMTNPFDEPPPSAHTMAIVVDENNVKWFATSGSVVSYDRSAWKVHEFENVFFMSAAVDQNNVKWFGTKDDGVWSFDGETWNSYQVEWDGNQFTNIGGIAIDSSNNVWCTTGIPTSSEGPDLVCIAKFDGTVWESYSSGIANGIYPVALAIDNQNTKWIGIDAHFFGPHDCLLEFDGSTWESYLKDVVFNTSVFEIVIGPDNIMWLGTSGDVVSFEDGTWKSHDPLTGFPNKKVFSIVVDKYNTKWFGSDAGVSRLVDIPMAVGEATKPNSISISGNYPNPFNPTTTIEFSLSVEAYATLDVFNLSGQHVATLVDDMLGAGTHAVVWGGADDAGAAVSSGVYFCRLQAEGRTAVHRMVLMR